MDLLTRKASVTAGFRCAPDTGPKMVIKTTNIDRYSTKIAKTWEIVERNMKKAPGPDLVARHVLKLINAAHTSPRITVGDAFQSKIAPLIFRFLPQRVRLWGLKRYYKL